MFVLLACVLLRLSQLIDAPSSINDDARGLQGSVSVIPMPPCDQLNGRDRHCAQSPHVGNIFIVRVVLRPWLEELPDGPLITYRSAAIAEADTAFNSAVRRSKIVAKANTYSIRHSLSRYMRKRRVDLEEIGIYLGHGNHDPETETTLIYCPWEPEYLINCREAAEAFVREINTHTRKLDLLHPYGVKPNYIEN